MMGSLSAFGKEKAGLKTGDVVIVSAGVPFGRPGTTNTLNISKVE